MRPSDRRDELPRRSPILFADYRRGRPAPNKGMKLPAEPLTEREVLALAAECSARGSAGIRDRALIVLLWRTGLRIGEALALAPKDVDTHLGTVTVLCGKGRRRRTVGIDPQACAVIERWMERRRALGVPRFYDGEPSPLFCVIAKPSRGKALWASCVRDKLKELARRAGVEKRVHPHGLRHTCAFELTMEGTPITVIRRQLGHSSLATTERYVDHLAPAQVIAAMQRRSWGSAGHELAPPAA